MKDELEECLENTFQCVNILGLSLLPDSRKNRDENKLLTASIPMPSSLFSSSRAKCRQIGKANMLQKIGTSITRQCAVMSQLGYSLLNFLFHFQGLPVHNLLPLPSHQQHLSYRLASKHGVRKQILKFLAGV